MIPTFPSFKNLELSDRNEIEKYTSLLLPYAEYQFTTMWCWAVHKPFQLSIINNNLLIKQTNCLTGAYFFSLVGTNFLPETLKEISAFLFQNQLPLELSCIPEETVKCLDGMPVGIAEDRDNFDYVYNVAEYYHAKGNKYKIYRHKISGFTKSHPLTETRCVDLSDEHIKNQMASLFQLWTKNKVKNHKDASPVSEYSALNKLLSSAHKHKNLVALGIYDGENMIAFSINDINDGKYCTGLFWKADTDYKGVYQFLMKEIVHFSHDLGVEFLNWESDLGIEALRKSKLNLHPAFFLKKYIVEITNL